MVKSCQIHQFSDRIHVNFWDIFQGIDWKICVFSAGNLLNNLVHGICEFTTESAGEGLGLAVDQGIHLAECLQQGGYLGRGGRYWEMGDVKAPKIFWGHRKPYIFSYLYHLISYFPIFWLDNYYKPSDAIGHRLFVVTVVTLGPSLAGILMDGAGGPKHSYRLRSLPCRRRPGTQWEDYDTTLRHDSGGESLKLVRRKSGFEAKASVHLINVYCMSVYVRISSCFLAGKFILFTAGKSVGCPRVCHWHNWWSHSPVVLWISHVKPFNDWINILLSLNIIKHLVGGCWLV